MTATRPAVLLLAAVALAGCGKPDPAKPADPPPKADSPKAGPPSPKPGFDSAGNPAPPVQRLVTPSAPAGAADPARLAAEAFVKELAAGQLPPDLSAKLTPAFLKVIGKPLYSDAERYAGFRATAAEGWLKRAGAALAGVSPPSGSGGVFAGTFGNGAGRYAVRVATADGGPKVDWFQLGTAKAGDPAAGSADDAARDFAAVSFLDALTAGGPVTREDRLPLLAATLSPRLKAEKAEPFGQDKAQGNDYNPGALGRWADGFGGPADGFTRTAAGPDGFSVSLMRGGQPKGYSLKLVKEADGWRVDEFKPQ